MGPVRGPTAQGAHLKIFYDTEFLEDGYSIDLISIGMVREDGEELYLVNADANWERIRADKWLCENVLPQLPHWSKDVTRPFLADHVRRFVTHGLRPGENAELWAWYGSYDHVALCQLFGKMIDLPKGFPMFTHDLRQLTTSNKLPKQEDGKHDALEDARWLARAHRHHFGPTDYRLPAIAP